MTKKISKVNVTTNTDDKGNVSWIRKRGNLLLGFGLGIAALETISHIVYKIPVDALAVALASSLIGFAIGGKVVQKFAEK